MKISRTWLQTYFETELPDINALADALTFHAFEIDGIENDILDVKITANRGHDCLSHRGIAKELSAILGIPLTRDPFAYAPEFAPVANTLAVTIEDRQKCARYIGCHMRGVTIGPSPEWLVERLAAMGQHSINNVVDAANFIMFDLGQPLHAFDAGKREVQNGTREIVVRNAKAGEKLLALDEKEYELDPSMLVIADGVSGAVIGLAGLKGGKESGTWAETTELILEAATFDGPTLRKTSRKVKLRTDASSRFEQVLSPEVAAYAMRAFADLVQQLAGGEIVGFVDAYPAKQEPTQVSVSRAYINAILGVELSASEIESVFSRLGLAYEKQDEHYTLSVPSERLDLSPPAGGPADIVEEVGRIVGYDKVPAVELPPAAQPPAISEAFARAEAVRAHLVAQGFSEVFTSVFADAGERVVANKVDGVRPFLRRALAPGLADALERNVRTKDVLGLTQVKLFEIGTVWRDGNEEQEIAIAVEKVKKQKTQEQYQEELDQFVSSLQSTVYSLQSFPLPDVRYAPFSRYPFIVRDIALWVPEGTSGEEVLEVIRAHAGELLVRSAKFDEFAKDGRVSFAFRLVFQSMDRTLVDEDATERMQSIAAALAAKGWEVR